jgi:hypothetical protein
LFGHHIAKGILRNTKVVASHIEECVGHSKGEPIDKSVQHEFSAVSQRIIFKVQVDNDEKRRSYENKIDILVQKLSESHLQSLRQRLGGVRAFFGTLSFILSMVDFQLPNQMV